MATKKENIIKGIKDAKKVTAKAFSWMTADSKKIVIGLLFLTSVILDTILWKHSLYPAGKLFASNVFRAFALTIAIILTKDIQGLVNAWLEKKVIGKTIKKTKK